MNKTRIRKRQNNSNGVGRKGKEGEKRKTDKTRIGKCMDNSCAGREREREREMDKIGIRKRKDNLKGVGRKGTEGKEKENG